MPITPSAARQLRKPDNKLKHICERIDTYLVENHCQESDKCWWFSVTGVSYEMRQEIIALYTQMGWKVELVCDQRDGDALTFKE